MNLRERWEQYREEAWRKDYHALPFEEWLEREYAALQKERDHFQREWATAVREKHELFAVRDRLLDTAAGVAVLLKAKCSESEWAAMPEDFTQVLAEHDRELLERAAQDTKRLDWIEEFIQTGVLTCAFELDGGVHVTLAAVGDKAERAFREQDSFRAGVDAAMCALAAPAEAAGKEQPKNDPTLHELHDVWKQPKHS